MKKLIVANWKMNLDPHQAELLATKLDQRIMPGDDDIVLCPPVIDLYSVAKSINGDKFKLGGQNCHHKDEGAFTGETSPAVLKQLANYVITGHSERRRYNHEDDKLVAAKTHAALRNGLKPIVCVGESADDRLHGLAHRVVTDQLTAGLHQVDAGQLDQVAIAYEPVWAIGTGDFAKPGDVEQAVRQIRRCLEDLFGESAGGQARILYGGSVDADNCVAYLKLPGVDGLLVGGASLNPDVFAAIVKTAQKL